VISNRSVPADAILPHVVYEDVEEAIAWLTNAFGFVEHYRYGSPVAGAQMRAGNAWIMLHRVRQDRAIPKSCGFGTQSLSVFIHDVEEHYQRAKAAGLVLLEDLHETVYGELQYAVQDLAGHHWIFSRHARNLSPADWGAVVASPAAPNPRISPMLAVSDGAAAIAFYQAAFGADLLWRLGDEHVVAGLSVQGANFFLATESAEFGTRSPGGAGFTSVRIELFVDDPEAAQRRALAAGAVLRSPVEEHTYPTTGPQPIRRMLQGSVIDPFGHMWLIGKFLE